MTALQEAPPQPPRAAGRRRTPLVAALLVAALALLALAGLRAAPGTARFAPAALSFSGEAPVVTLPSYGPQGMHVVGYDHGATTQVAVRLRNDGPLPLTVTGVAVDGGVAPLLAVRAVAGLPVDVPAGGEAVVEVTAELGNCEYFHEREVQNYAAAEVAFTVLGRPGTATVPFDRPVMVHSPMIVGCPDRLLDRQAHDRSDLTGAA